MLKFTYPGFDAGCSYHNHSNMSDGTSSLEELCRTGKKNGLRELGVSDHWVIPPFDPAEAASWRMDPERLDEYIEKLLALKKELDDEHFTLRIGLEVDYFPENYRDVLKKLSSYPLDYVIGSVQYSGSFPLDSAKELWLPLDEEQRAELCKTYWRKLEGAACCPEFAFLGHLDLPKKFGMIDNRAYFAHARRVLDIAKQHNKAIELNTSGWFKECQEQYPALEILQYACSLEIPVVLNADAHAAANLTRNFAQGIEQLRQAGYPAAE